MKLNALFYNFNESCDNEYFLTAMSISQTHPKLIYGPVAVICWLVQLFSSWALCFNLRWGLICLKYLFCPLVSLPVLHLIWTFLCVFMYGVYAFLHVHFCVLVCFFYCCDETLTWGEKGFNKQRQKSEEGAATDTMEETLFTGLLPGTCLATCFFVFLFFLLSSGLHA